MSGLRTALLRKPEMFVGTLDREAADLRPWAAASSTTTRPSVREIVASARAQDYRFSSLVLGIVSSDPFQMRMSQ